MKVLNVNMILDLVTGGGTAERTYQMSKALSEKGVRCTLLTTDVGLTRKRVKSLDGVKVIALPIINKRFYIPWISFLKLKKIVSDADVIHLMNHWTLLNAIVYLFAKRYNKPYVVCPAGTLYSQKRSNLLKKFYNFVIGKKIIRGANRSIAIGFDEIKQFERYGVPPKKVIHLPNGVKIDDYCFDGESKILSKHRLSDAPFILFVGRLNLIKGPDLLLEAFCGVSRMFPDYHLVFVGPDEGELEKLRKISKDSGVTEKVHFLGYIEGAEKAKVYKQAKLLVIPSRQEMMSIVVLEAGIVGTPVILTDRCGFNEVEKIGGGLVVPASVAGMREGLTGMLSKPENIKVSGEKLKNHVLRNYTWEVLIEKYLKMYKEIISEPRNGKKGVNIDSSGGSDEYTSN
jgi:glycosyltransferase involved in cell wall biosynthesis